MKTIYDFVFFLGHNSRKRALWIITVAALILSIFLCIICFVVWMRRRRKGLLLSLLQHSSKKNYHLFMLSALTFYVCPLNLGTEILHDQAAANRPEEDELVWRLEEKSSEFTLFDLSEVLRATHNFSKENLLGKGGFGPVYKVNALSRKDSINILCKKYIKSRWPKNILIYLVIYSSVVYSL